MNECLCLQKAISIMRRESVNKLVRLASRRFLEVYEVKNISVNSELNFEVSYRKPYNTIFLNYHESFSYLLVFQYLVSQWNEKKAHIFWEKFDTACSELHDEIGAEYYLVRGLRYFEDNNKIEGTDNYQQHLARIEKEIVTKVEDVDVRTEASIAFLSFISAEVSIRRRDYLRAIQFYRKAQSIYPDKNNLIEQIIFGLEDRLSNRRRFNLLEKINNFTEQSFSTEAA